MTEINPPEELAVTAQLALDIHDPPGDNMAAVPVLPTSLSHSSPPASHGARSRFSQSRITTESLRWLTRRVGWLGFRLLQSVCRRLPRQVSESSGTLANPEITRLQQGAKDNDIASILPTEKVNKLKSHSKVVIT